MDPLSLNAAGEAANRRAITEPGRVAREFKRRIGDPTPLLVGGSPYSAEYLSAQLLRWVIDQVSEVEGQPPSRIAVTHPANWGSYKLDLLEQAIRLADLDDVVTLTEPEAAAIHYSTLERIEPGMVVAVYDLGGGTFDAAVLRKTADGFDILGEPEGIERLGGIDFDEAVFSFVTQSLGPRFSELDTSDTATAAAVARLRRECVEAKEVLSQDTEVTVPVVLPDLQTEVRLTRSELEAMIRPSLAATVEAMQRAVHGCGLDMDQVDRILLVGGSSRIPLVGQMVGGELGRPIAVDAHPKHSVARGAALAAQPNVVVAVGPEPPTVSEPPVALSLSTSKAEGSRRKTLTIAGLVLFAIVAAVGTAVALGGGGDDRPIAAIATEGEIFLQAASSPGPDAFSQDVDLLAPGGVPQIAVGTLTAGQVVVQGAVTTVVSSGTEPGLYGGTMDNARCDREALIGFLEQNTAKGEAWAAVHGIQPGQIAEFVRRLTPVTLLSDTRVTNHGFKNQGANGFQSVLQAGTAVLVDETGTPRARCACGNPLLGPVAQTGSATYTGESWAGFGPKRLAIIQPGDPTDELVLTDLGGGAPFVRPVGTGGEVDAAADATPTLTVSASTTTTTAPPATADITPAGRVSASSTFGADFSPSLAVDGSATSSWFSAGGGSATFTWQITKPEIISQVTITGNGAHATTAFQTGFGFEGVTVELYSVGLLVGTAEASLKGTPDPTVQVDFGLEADEIRLLFSGGEDPSCGGFSELNVVALR